MGRQENPASSTMVIPIACAGSGVMGAAARAPSFARDNRLCIAMAAASLMIFAGLLADVLLRGGLFGLDRSVNTWAASIQSASLDPFMVAVGLVFDPYGIAAVMLSAAIFLRFKGSRRDSRRYILIVLLAGAFIEIFKFAVQRDRPPNMITGVSGFSFPSGHATMAVVSFGSVIHLAGRKGLSRFCYMATVATSIFMILLIGFDRIYLNVHWLSDVLGGFAAGTFAMSAAILVRTRRERRTSQFVGPVA